MNNAPTHWEYKVVTESGAASEAKMTANFNAFGAEGWELVAFAHEEYRFRAIFKRPARGEGAGREELAEPARSESGRD